MLRVSFPAPATKLNKMYAEFVLIPNVSIILSPLPNVSINLSPLPNVSIILSPLPNVSIILFSTERVYYSRTF